MPEMLLNPQTSDTPEKEIFEFLYNSTNALERLYVNNGFKAFAREYVREIGITYELFIKAFDEAVAILRVNIDRIIGRIRQNRDYARRFRENITLIGFTGASRRLKADMINKLYDALIDFLANTEENIQRFFDHIRIPKRFLDGINLLYGSLSKLVPGADAVKEIKEVSEFLFKYRGGE